MGDIKQLQKRFEPIGVDVDRTKWGVIPQDDPTLDPMVSILPEQMILAGQAYVMKTHDIPPDAARETAINLFREMSKAAPRFDHFNSE